MSMNTVSRAEFLKGSAMAAAGVAAAGLASTAIAEMPESWDYEADIVAIGSGAGGMLACAAAHENGASTLLIEKNAYTGGDSLVCHQDILACWPERTVIDCGVADDYDAYMADWKATHEFSSIKGIKGIPLAEETPMIERQVQAFGAAGNWIVDVAGAELTPVDLGSSLATADVFPGPRCWHGEGDPIVVRVQAVLETYEDFQLLTSTEALSLIQDESGRVVGVRCFDTEGRIVNARANKAVILATGMFCANVGMMARYVNSTYAQCLTYGNTGATGDGLRMAMEIGAATRDLDLGCNFVSNWMGSDNYWDVNAHLGQFGAGEGMLALNDPAIFVNREGKRYANEQLGYNGMARNAAEQTSRIGYYVFDSQNADQDLINCPAIVRVADSLEELAAQLAIPADEFVATVEQYNGYVDAGEDPDFGKNLEGCTRIEQPPFYGLTIVPRPYVTLGGVATDIDSRVIDHDGAPIPGLYAAGGVTGIYSEQEGVLYYGGFGQALTFGFQAGTIASTEN